MKAIQFKSFGSPDVLELVELPRPACPEGSAIVQVRSSSVNPSDVKNVAGSFGKTTLPRVPGRDFSGMVVEGPASWVGADVWGTGGDIGFTRDGSQAEFLMIPVAALVRKPESLSHEQASAIGVNFIWRGSARLTMPGCSRARRSSSSVSAAEWAGPSRRLRKRAAAGSSAWIEPRRPQIPPHRG